MNFGGSLALDAQRLWGQGRVRLGNVGIDVTLERRAGQPLSVTGSTGDIDTGWMDFCGGDFGCTKGRLRWNATVSLSGDRLMGSLSATAAGWYGLSGPPSNLDDVPGRPGIGKPGFSATPTIPAWNGESVGVPFPGEFTSLLPPGLSQFLSSRFQFDLNRP